ncbi:MAG: DUF268 domain-containing protein [Candidatus Kapaibacteriales bacterium]
MCKFLRLCIRFFSPIFDFRNFKPLHLLRYPKFILDYFVYKSKADGKVNFLDIYPIFEKKSAPQLPWNEYLIQDLWALEKISSSGVQQHTDIGSRLDGFVCQLAVLIPVDYVDIRRPGMELQNLHYIYGSILDLPFSAQSITSLSSLHVVEHIGLGRYFDKLDPNGTQKALKELERVLAPGGNLYLGIPIGVERTEFNANRIFHPLSIVRSFSSAIDLVEFAFAPKNETLQRYFDINMFPSIDYAIGLFHFRRREF